MDIQGGGQQIYYDPVKKKEEKILEIYKKPLLPALTKTLAVLAVLITIAMVLSDLNIFLRYNRASGYSFLIRNLFATIWICSCVFSAILIPLSILGIIVNIREDKKKLRTLKRDLTQEDAARRKRALRRRNTPYRVYVIVTGLILLASSLLSWIVSSSV